jgi:hypothetical protein
MPRLVGELDAACAPLLDAARTSGARVWVVSEYGHCDVSRPVLINPALRRAGLLSVRPGPFGEVFDPLTSRAFAVCDHQLAHVHVRHDRDRPSCATCWPSSPGVARLVEGEGAASSVSTIRGRGAWSPSRRPRLVRLSLLARRPEWRPTSPGPWTFTRKPGYDPCELFFDPGALLAPGGVPCSGWRRRRWASGRSSTSSARSGNRPGKSRPPRRARRRPPHPHRRRAGPRRGRLPGPRDVHGLLLRAIVPD